MSYKMFFVIVKSTFLFGKKFLEACVSPGLIYAMQSWRPPEIEIKNISLRDGGMQGHKLFVTVNYSLVNNDEEDAVTLSFTNENFN